MKWLFGFLLLLSIVLLALIQWGGALTGSGKIVPTLGELHREKIILLDEPVIVPSPALVTVPAPLAVLMPLVAGLSAESMPVAVTVQAAAPLHVSSSAPAVVPLVKSADEACMEWGEFSGTDLERSEKELAALKLGDHLSKRTVEYDKGYRVFIPSLLNKAEIRKSINEIKAAGIAEYYVLSQKGQWHNAISLGLFKTEEAAKHYLEAVKKNGIRTAKIAAVERKLQFVVFVIKELDAAGLTNLNKLQQDFPYSELKKVTCTN